MNNLSQQQQDAKQAYLNKQLEQTIAHYENAETSERNAIIKHIDSFLPVTKSKDEKNFWLKVREKLERLKEK